MDTLASFTVGEGSRGVVLLHGFLGSGKNVRSLAQRWIERRPDQRILVPDLPGHGQSPPLPPDADQPWMATQILEAAASASLAEPLTLVGHSLGGRVALAAAEQAPERLSQIILLDIAPGPIDAKWTGSGQVLDALLAAPAEVPDRRTMREYLLGRGISPATTDWLLMNLESAGEAGYRWRIDRPALAAFHDAFNRTDLWPVVEARRLPIRCIRGGRSRQVNEKDVARFQAAGGRVDTIPEATHHLHVDALDALVDLL